MGTETPQQHWERQAPIYASDKGHRRFGRFLTLYEESCWRYIKPLLPQIDECLILEAGCGSGRWVYHLAPMGYRMVLVDLSPEMIRHCREQVERRGLSDRVLGYHTLDICDMHELPEASFDLVLVMGGPLSLCRDVKSAIREFHRVTKPGGYVVCDVANRYRTALDLVRDKEMGQVASLLDTGGFSRPDGLTDYRFTPGELPDLFAANGLRPRSLAAICPFFDFLPALDQVRILDDEGAYETMLAVGERYAEDGAVISLSGRLLVVAQKGA